MKKAPVQITPRWVAMIVTLIIALVISTWILIDDLNSSAGQSLDLEGFWVEIPGGEFQMGYGEGDNDHTGTFSGGWGSPNRGCFPRS